jgi:hypothetical protein
MSATEKTISSLISSQLPDFVKANHPQFQRFIELYYQWLEQNSPSGVSNTAGNTVYQAGEIANYRDIDQTPDDFVRYFKQELLPYFPENTSLDIKKILKSAREFYSKKGSEESIKWLFKALFNEDIEINYPKEQILKTSDGKWKLPRAFRITVGETNKALDVNLLEKRLVTGNVSGATCVIETANRTIDPTNGIEVIEIYISNIKKFFENGEFITVNYTDENGVEQTFSEKIIGTISNIRIDSNIRTDPSQRRRGLLYNVGDPVVITGGLALTAEANDAVAIVGNVSVGSIESVATTFPGYGYQIYSNTETIVLRSTSDDPNANANTDLRVIAINVSACTTNSQQNFVESITYDKTIIDYLGDTVIGLANLAAFTVNNRNAIINVTENDEDDPYNNYEEIWANGNNFTDALFTAKIATPNNAIFGVGGISANTGDLLIYDIKGSNTALISDTDLPIILNGAQINTKNTAKSFVYNSVTSYYVPANANSLIVQCVDFETVNTGGIALIAVEDGGFGFRSGPALQITSHYDTHLSEQYDYTAGGSERINKRATWQTFKDLGQIAHVWINNGGTGYANGEIIVFEGRGYGGNAFVNVNATGTITTVTLTDRGEGHLVRPTANIQTSGGTGAVLTSYLFGDGVENTVGTNAIGRIRNLRLVYRGFDYVATPNVNLKIVDTIINPIPEAQNFTEGEYIYQGPSLATSTFKANVKQYIRSTGLLRLYNFSGIIDTTVDLLTQNSVYANVNTSANVPAPLQYPPAVVATGLPNPMYYGDGRARANALFANGLIEFDGFYLNTDGFPSSDKRLQDAKLYHNFSYIVQSDRSLVEFETPLKNIVHPAGMSVISKTILKSNLDTESTVTSNVHYIKSPTIGTNTPLVTIANSYSNVVTGSQTNFEAPASKVNVGDLFIISDTSNPLRSISKVVSAVNSNTELEIYGDFIYTGQGKITIQNGNTSALVTGNVNAVSDFMQVGDQIRVNVPNVTITGTVNVTGTTVAGNSTGSNATYFLGNVVVGSEITINGETRLVTVVTDANTLTVNSAFDNAAEDKYLIANSIFVKDVDGISGNVLTMNTAIFNANLTNVVYLIVPDYSTTSYPFNIITLNSSY